jgi:hypothetical protein
MKRLMLSFLSHNELLATLLPLNLGISRSILLIPHPDSDNSDIDNNDNVHHHFENNNTEPQSLFYLSPDDASNATFLFRNDDLALAPTEALAPGYNFSQNLLSDTEPHPHPQSCGFEALDPHSSLHTGPPMIDLPLRVAKDLPSFSHDRVAQLELDSGGIVIGVLGLVARLVIALFLPPPWPLVKG